MLGLLRRRKKKSLLEKQTEELVKRVFQKVTMMPSEEIDTEKSFVSYELDSYLAFEMVSMLKEVVPELPMTIFIQCRNIEQISEYLITNHKKELKKYIG